MPDVPECVSAIEVCCCRHDHEWALYECFGDWEPACEALESSAACRKAPEKLQVLLRSAQHWPPALALAREELADERLTKDDFIARLQDSLRRRLESQRTVPYFLARARVECLIGGLRAGQYVWLVGHNPVTNRVAWVAASDDYFVYWDPAENFDVTPEDLQALRDPRDSNQNALAVAASSSRASACFWTALCLTAWALFANNVSLASGDYRGMVLSAVGFSVSALALIGIGWSRMSFTLRALSLVIALAACWTLIDGGGRRLPAIFGW